MENKEKEVDLDKARDEKCIPIAREVLKDLATTLLPEDANKVVDYNPAILKIMKRSLDHDLNISTECTYIFQLILGAFTGLNKTVQGCSTILIDDVRYGRIGGQILTILSEANVRFGNVSPEEVEIDFAPVKEKINALFAEEKLSMMEVKYIMDNIFEGLKMVQSGFSESVEKSTQKAEAKALGIEFMSDLTMGRLNDVLMGVPFPKLD